MTALRVCYSPSQLLCPAILLALTTSTQSAWSQVAETNAAHADRQEVRACEFEVKARCAFGDARVTLADGAVIRLEVSVYWCGLPGHPTFACTIDTSRADKDWKWSQEGAATLIVNGSPWNPDQPDRVKITVGRDVSIDFDDTQPLGKCGAGAELPRAIVIPAQKTACRVRLSAP
jgi:hypothetical protein